MFNLFSAVNKHLYCIVGILGKMAIKISNVGLTFMYNPYIYVNWQTINVDKGNTVILRLEFYWISTIVGWSISLCGYFNEKSCNVGILQSVIGISSESTNIGSRY